jgi:hypothetical protein
MTDGSRRDGGRSLSFTLQPLPFLNFRDRKIAAPLRHAAAVGASGATELEVAQTIRAASWAWQGGAYSLESREGEASKPPQGWAVVLRGRLRRQCECTGNPEHPGH